MPDVSCRLTLLSLAVCIGLVLQGCGSGGKHDDPDKPKPKPGHTICAANQTAQARTAPLSVAEAVKYFNQQYMAYDFEHPNKTSPLGITISFANAPEDFNQNLFCHEFTNTGCHEGFADCRMSASLFNWKIASNNYVWATTFGRAVGYIFNQTLVETAVGKCMYVFDGASENRLNNGCGLGTVAANCSLPKENAFADLCPSTGKVCTASDSEVKDQMCSPDGPVAPPVASDKGNQCFFSMPALNYPQMDHPNHLQLAVAARVADELKTNNYKDHNELVIDNRVLIPRMCEDPAVTIPAFVVAKSRAAEGIPAAKKMRDKFSKDYNVGKIPIIGVNDVSSFEPNGPFFDPNITDSEELEVLV